MRIDLVELLNSREICHPTRINLLETKSSRQIRIEVCGYPWWLEKTPPHTEGKICFIFNNILDVNLDSGVFCRDDYEEDLELLSASLLSEKEWAIGTRGEIYCSSPISDPYSLYANLEDYLISIGCPYSARDYLNMGGRNAFSKFKEVTSNKSYLLARAPEQICKVICEFLKAQKIEFNTLPGPEGYNVIKGKVMSKGLVYVQLGGGFIICGEAYAFYEEK